MSTYLLTHNKIPFCPTPHLPRGLQMQESSQSCFQRSHGLSPHTTLHSPKTPLGSHHCPDSSELLTLPGRHVQGQPGKHRPLSQGNALTITGTGLELLLPLTEGDTLPVLALAQVQAHRVILGIPRRGALTAVTCKHTGPDESRPQFHREVARILRTGTRLAGSKGETGEGPQRPMSVQPTWQRPGGVPSPPKLPNVSTHPPWPHLSHYSPPSKYSAFGCLL